MASKRWSWRRTLAPNFRLQSWIGILHSRYRKSGSVYRLLYCRRTWRRCFSHTATLPHRISHTFLSYQVHPGRLPSWTTHLRVTPYFVRSASRYWYLAWTPSRRPKNCSLSRRGCDSYQKRCSRHVGGNQISPCCRWYRSIPSDRQQVLARQAFWWMEHRCVLGILWVQGRGSSPRSQYSSFLLYEESIYLFRKLLFCRI